MINKFGVLVLAIGAAFSGSADGADIKVMSANVFTNVIEEIAKDFTSATGHKVTIDDYTVGQVRERIQKAPGLR